MWFREQAFTILEVEVMDKIIAILDFGSQYTQVIARRIRESHVHSRIFHYSTSAEKLREEGVAGIILSGGPCSVFQENAPHPDPELFELGVPVLGICYGLQLMGELLGGEVASSEEREYGHGMLDVVEKESPLFKGVKGRVRVWNSHGDKLTGLPEGFVAIASTENSLFAAIGNDARKFYGIQFHPEVAHSEQGTDMLRNFLFAICGCEEDWQMKNFAENSIRAIKERVGDKHVILGLSGGVDSSVAAALIHRAIGDQLTCVFVDNGLLRANERETVEALFRDTFHMDLRTVDAGERFLSKLKGVSDPEQKRKIIGHEFVAVFEDTIKAIGVVEFLAQGTLYPDVIESVAIEGNPAALIKTHHNVGGLPQDMKLQLLEPLNELFKDEVRALGEELGLPHRVLYRHPFPGPGLAVRVMGDIRPEYLNVLRQADAIFMEELETSGHYNEVWQAFCVFLPVRTVGVMGDERTYEHVVALRAVESSDAMTANWAHLPHDFLQKVSSRIINEVRGVNRVVLDISSKPPSTIEWE